MAKYTTAIQGYYLGHNQIEKFVRGEIGTEKESLAMLHKIRKEMKGQLPAKKTKDAEESPEVKAKRVAAANAAFAMAKRDHHVQYSRFQRYGVKLKSLFDGKETIGKDTLKELMTLNQAKTEMEF